MPQKENNANSPQDKHSSAHKVTASKWQIHKKLYNWVVGWADTKYGFLALIILAITEPICVPIPADVMVIGMSLGKPKKGIKYGLTCAAFSVIGGTIAFMLGNLIGGENIIKFFEQISIGPLHLGEKAKFALELYQKHDEWAVGISALTPVPYMLFSWLGGMAEVSIVKFILISVIFRTIRFGSEGLIFYYYGKKARNYVEKYFNIATVAVMILIILVVTAMKLIGKAFAG